MQPAINFLLDKMHGRAIERGSESACDIETNHTAADDEEIRLQFALPNLPWSLARLPEIFEVVFSRRVSLQAPKRSWRYPMSCPSRVNRSMGSRSQIVSSLAM